MGIKNFKPLKKSRYKQGYLKLKNKSKYLGDPNLVIYRSSYEKKFYKELDEDNNVVGWEAEPEWLKVKYVDPISKKIRTYYPDVFVIKNVNGERKQFVIEIKSNAFLKKPIKKQNMTPKQRKSYMKKMYNFLVIMSKKSAAQKMCERKGWEYLFMTETYINRV